MAASLILDNAARRSRGAISAAFSIARAYDVDPEADQAADVARALAYCRDALRSPTS
jgi:hypothetical protein